MSTEGERLETQRDVLTIEEAAELLGVSVKTFNKVLHSESLPGRKIGREWKFSRQALIDWIGAGRSDDFYRDPREVKREIPVETASAVQAAEQETPTEMKTPAKPKSTTTGPAASMTSDTTCAPRCASASISARHFALA